jgi:lambda repressor-like predicted transcriptional regulator
LIVAVIGGFFWWAISAISATVAQCGSTLVELANQAACATDTLRHTLGEAGFAAGALMVTVGVITKCR